ncbi:hypothetical protein EIN_274520 [Entamoeba invadens IP1]|uniref:DUF4832 domain-containing protein n=1 Tax=Entamoeba invadens IP1 TaxID=370355 RepID=A0A0A1U1H3_ENTIV|nr:hypothetical protein EIN_274520 [Entamoeba invadens IP1]ELP87875.1 hypothetical protein EIN_274520 [Entamoeba invadens IP1]|eukprot:XP_004254646.1 hypothetical protein EIN_274520 [Entamoeba invadens IP1]
MKKIVVIFIVTTIAFVVFISFTAVVIGLAVGLSVGDESSSSVPHECISGTYYFKRVDEPLGNPLKGFCNWYGNSNVPNVPFSLQYSRIEVDKLLTKENTVDLSALEQILVKCNNSKTQAVVRLVLDAPSEKSFVPRYIQDKITMYSYGYDPAQSPNYNDNYLLEQLSYLMTEIGKVYDGDGRIAFWQLGLYGHWGEWHEYYIKDTTKKATSATLDRIMDMHLNNLKRTKCEVRIAEERSELRKIGLYHDMFNNQDDDSYMMSLMITHNMTDRWKTESFGGEDYPAGQSEMFSTDSKLEKYLENVELFHPSFMLSADYFSKKQTDENFNKRRKRAERKMGYNLFLQTSRVEYITDSIQINVNVSNDGVAPFYYDWKVNFGIIQKESNGNVTIIKEEPSSVVISGILPGVTKEWGYTFGGLQNVEQYMKDDIFVALRVPSPVNSFVLFANKEQRDDGWVVFGKC